MISGLSHTVWQRILTGKLGIFFVYFSIFIVFFFLIFYIFFIYIYIFYLYFFYYFFFIVFSFIVFQGGLSVCCHLPLESSDTRSMQNW